mgnify:CR=1
MVEHPRAIWALLVFEKDGTLPSQIIQVDPRTRPESLAQVIRVK